MKDRMDIADSIYGIVRVAWRRGIVRTVRLMRDNCGYTLYMVLVILSIAAVLFSVTLFGVRSAYVTAKKSIQSSQAYLLARSGMVKAEWFLNGGDGHSYEWETPEYVEKVEPYGTIQLALKQFGLYKRVTATGTCKRASETRSRVYGRTLPLDLFPTLTITGHIGGLICKEQSYVEGTMVFHHGYVYKKKGGMPIREYTPRITFKPSPPLPFDTTLLPGFFAEIDTLYASAFKQGFITNLGVTDSNNTLLHNHPLVIHGDYSIHTSGCRALELFVKGTCTITDGAVLEDCSVYADRIHIKGGVSRTSFFWAGKGIVLYGGSHNSQFICADSITVKRQVVTGPMTLFTVLRKAVPVDSATVISGGVYFENNATIQGTVLCAAENEHAAATSSPSVILGKGCRFHGVIVTDGDCLYPFTAHK